MKELKVIDERVVLEKEFRIYGTVDEPLFLAKDVAEWIEYGFDSKGNRDTNAMLRTVDDEEKCKNTNPINNRVSWFLTEDGLYEVLMQSRKPIAKQFKKKVKEILKTIRKHGMYATDELLNNPDLLIEVATKLTEERAARIAAEKERNKLIHQSKLYTSSEIAKELGMSSAAKLNKFLEEKKIQYKLNNTWLLYSEYSEDGLASIKQQILDNGHVIYDRRWTGKGRDFILDLYLNRK